MVALTCRDHMTPVFLAVLQGLLEEVAQLAAAHEHAVEHFAFLQAQLLLDLDLAVLPTNSMRTSPALAMVMDCSLEKKSPPRT